MSGPTATPKRKMPAKKQPAAAAKTQTNGKPPKRVVEAPKPKRNIPVVGIAFGVIALLLILAVTLTGNTGPGGAFGDPQLEGEVLPFFDSTAGDQAVGQQAPVVTGENFGGEEVVIGNSGEPTAVVFLAHWCPHCQAEVPRVQEWLDATGGVEGVEIMSVATSTNSARANYPPSEWLQREGWDSPVLLDDTDSSVHLSYGGGGFPYWVFLNADGTVAARSAGELDIASLEQLMLTIAPQSS